MKRIISVLLVLILLCVTGVASLSAYGTKQEVSEEKKVEENIKASRFETLLNNNYAFADDFSSVSKILDCTLISLLPHAKNGALENRLIIDYMINMYGIDPSLLYDEGAAPLNAEGNTEIPAKGFVKYTHTVNKIHVNADGTFTVYSVATAEEFGETVTKDAISRFVPADTTFGYILVSCELLLTTDSATAEI